MKTPHSRRNTVLTCLFSLLLLLMLGCGSDSNTSSNNNNGNNTGGSNGSGTPTPGGSNTGGSGGGAGGGSSSSNTFVFAGGASDAGGVYGWKFDRSAGTFTPTPGPLLLTSGSSTGGALATSGNFVYYLNRPQELGAAAIYTFQPDKSTGQLTQTGDPVSVTSAADNDARRLVMSRSGETIYVVTQNTVSAVAANGGHPSLLNQQSLANGEIFGFAVGDRFAYVGSQDGNPKQGFAQPVIKRVSLGANGSLSDAGQVVVTLTGSNIPRDLAVDSSNRFLAVTTGANNSGVSVYAIGSDGSLTEVAGSPFSTNGGDGHRLAFDSSGKFLYVIVNQEPVPNAESILVYTVASNGALAQVQTLDLPSDVRVSGFKIENDYVLVANDAVGGPTGTVTALKRDPSSGKLSVAGPANTNRPIGQVDLLSF